MSVSSLDVNKANSSATEKRQGNGIPVIVLNWNGWDDTIECLQRLREIDDGNLVWLVDNHSTLDRTAECVAIIPSLRVVKLDENFGWSGGYNRALDIASSEGFENAYLLNNDALPEPAFLQEAENVMNSDARAAAVGSIVLFSNSRSIKFDGGYHLENERLLDSSVHNRPYEVDQINGAGMLVRLKAFRLLGGFDERFFCYAEETEWCRRVKRSGWRLWAAPKSAILHSGEGSDVNSNARYYRLRNRFLMDLLTPRSEGRMGIVRNARKILGQARVYWQEGDEMGYFTMLAALRDGLLGRFGKRQDVSTGLALRMVVFSYIWITSMISSRGATGNAGEVRAG